MFDQYRYSKIEKDKNTVKQEKEANSLKGFRRDLYGIPSTTKNKSMNLSSLQHAQEAWNNLEHLVKEENPRIVHSQELRWKSSEDWKEAWDAKMREERWKGQEVPMRSSKQWEKAWDFGMELQRLDKEKEQQQLNDAVKGEQWYDAVEEQQSNDAMKEVQWEGRKGSTKLSEQRRSGRHSR